MFARIGMATKILIDGYNFLWQDRLFRDEAIKGHDKGREAVLDWLAKRPQLQAFDTTVVFDAYKTDAFHPAEHTERGVRVVFTASGQRADDWIRAAASELGPAAIVVSSDVEVMRHAEKKGCGVLSSKEFQIAVDRPETFEADPSRRFGRAKRKALARLLRLTESE
jgi:predicted RNA-binding protein with PIN domain